MRWAANGFTVQHKALRIMGPRSRVASLVFLGESHLSLLVA